MNKAILKQLKIDLINYIATQNKDSGELADRIKKLQKITEQEGNWKD